MVARRDTVIITGSSGSNASFDEIDLTSDESVARVLSN
jgi:hypothetical protein